MKRLTLQILMVLILSVGALSFQSCEKDDMADVAPQPNNSSLKTSMRYLWSDHATWTRDVIIGILDQTTYAGDVLNRLLKNQEDIGDAIKPYYGDAAGTALTNLLKEHIIVAGDILVAARDGNSSGLSEAADKWYKNGDDIAVFLNSANPENWLLDPMKMHMKHHLDLTLAEAVAHAEGRHSDEVVAYDGVYEQLMGLADQLSDGIAKQFPKKFK